MIPGNPGNRKLATIARDCSPCVLLAAAFYSTFSRHLAARLGYCDVASVAHVGHSGRGQSHTFLHLDDQVAHKIALVRDLLAREPDLRLVLAGHSVGAYICLHLMRQFSANVLRCFMLFPTVENIGTTPNGQRMAPLFLLPSRLAAAAVASALPVLLPKPLLRRAVSAHLGLAVTLSADSKRAPAAASDARSDNDSAAGSAAAVAEHNATTAEGVLDLLSWRACRASLRMAAHEMKEIRALNEWGGDDVIRQHAQRIVWYFGQNDQVRSFCWQLAVLTLQRCSDPHTQ
jgi:pimeloyl-ACP methyl ester carboxylesterase